MVKWEATNISTYKFGLQCDRKSVKLPNQPNIKKLESEKGDTLRRQFGRPIYTRFILAIKGIFVCVNKCFFAKCWLYMTLLQGT